MNDAIDQTPQLQPVEKGRKLKSHWLLIIFISIVGIIIIVMITVIVKKSINLHMPLAPSASPTPMSNHIHRAVRLESCSLRKEGNPLVSSLTVFKNGLTGSFRGTVIDTTYAGQKITSLTLLSVDKTESYTVDIQAENARSLTLTGRTLQIPNNIKRGSLVLINFRCSPRTNNQFVIIFIGTAAKEIKR